MKKELFPVDGYCPIQIKNGREHFAWSPLDGGTIHRWPLYKALNKSLNKDTGQLRAIEAKMGIHSAHQLLDFMVEYADRPECIHFHQIRDAIISALGRFPDFTTRVLNDLRAAFKRGKNEQWKIAKALLDEQHFLKDDSKDCVIALNLGVSESAVKRVRGKIHNAHRAFFVKVTKSRKQ